MYSLFHEFVEQPSHWYVVEWSSNDLCILNKEKEKLIEKKRFLFKPSCVFALLINKSWSSFELCIFKHDDFVAIKLSNSPREGWFHGTCDTIYTTFTKSVETFRTCAIIISKTFSPLDKSYTTFSWGSVGQIPNTLRNGSLKYLLLCNPRSFALLYAKEILMIDSDSSSSGLSESIYLKKF